MNTKHKVLNVDDYEVKRYARTHILTQAGYEVTEASTGAETLRLVSASPPDLVLLDINLPDMNGLEICRRIKSNPATSSVMVLHISSTFVEKADRTRGLENGADAYVTEPVDPGELVASVNALIRLRKAESALRQASREWRATFDAIHDGVCLLDPDAVVRRVNRSLCRMLGMTMDDLIGASSRNLFGPACEALDRMIETQRFQTTLHAIGDRTYEVGFSPVRGEEGDPLGAVGTFRDITELLRAAAEREQLLAREQFLRAEAEAASRVKDQFLATVSHDLRGPLQAILIWTRLLKEVQLDEAARLRTVESLDRSAQAQARLIDDLLDLSAIVTGKMKLEVGPTDIRSVILMTLETVEPTAEARQITVTSRLGRDRAVVLGDPGRLQQVLWNLLFNAVKFTPKGGHIDVGLDVQEDAVSVTVTDNGEGIPPDLLPHIFESFRQGPDRSGRSGGLGLGLSIARSLVELHGGTLTAESAGVSMGSTFTLKLPLQSELFRRAPGGSSPA